MNAMTEDNEGISRSVFDIITSDHRIVMRLFEEIESSVGQTRIRLIEK